MNCYLECPIVCHHALQTDAAEPAVMHDIDVPRLLTATIVITLVMVGPVMIASFVVLYAIFDSLHVTWALAPTVWTLAVLSAAVAIWWMAAARKPHALREIDARLNADGEAGVVKAVETYLRRHRLDLKYHAPLMVSSLVQRRHLGLTARACDDDKRQAVEPIDVPFEPIPLNEADPSFAELRSGFGSDGLSHEGCNAQQADDASLRRTVQRNLRFAGGWFVPVVFVVLGFILVYQLVTGGAINPVHVFWFLMASASLLGIGGRGAWKSTRQWLLVPGGVVARKPARRQEQWQLHVFDRRKSVLLVRQANRNLWAVRVEDDEAHESAFLTQAEAHTLLRAWLSPLEPPPAEQLSDLE